MSNRNPPPNYQPIAQPSASSVGMGWSGLRVEHFRRIPSGEASPPPLSHLFLLLRADRPHHAWIDVEGAVFDGGVPPGSCQLIPAGASSRHRWSGEVEATTFQVEPSFVARVAAEACGLDPDGVRFPVVCCGPLHPAVQHDLSALRGELLTGGVGGRLCAEALATVLVVHLIRHTAVAPFARVTKALLARHVLRAVEEFVGDNLDTDLGLADLASVAHLSEYHFARLFRRTTGQTPHQYVINARVERSKGLITEGRLTLAEVAAAVGFSDQSHLTRHFRKLVGVTPRRFGAGTAGIRQMTAGNYQKRPPGRG